MVRSMGTSRRHRSSRKRTMIESMQVQLAIIEWMVRVSILTSFVLSITKVEPGTLALLWNSAGDGRKGDKFQAWYLAKTWEREFSGSAILLQALNSGRVRMLAV